MYATYVIRKLFHGEPEETTHERSTSFNIEIPELEGGDDLVTVLQKIDETFPQKYLSVFEEAFISVDQLRRLDACHMTEYLNIPLGHAMRICGYFGWILRLSRLEHLPQKALIFFVWFKMLNFNKIDFN